VIRRGQVGSSGGGGRLTGAVQAKAVIRRVRDEGSRVGDEEVYGTVRYVNSIYSARLNAIIPTISVKSMGRLANLCKIAQSEGSLPEGLLLSIEEMMTREIAIILIFNKIEIPTEDCVGVVGDVGVDELKLFAPGGA
jgi:hypothetical protein